MSDEVEDVVGGVEGVRVGSAQRTVAEKLQRRRRKHARAVRRRRGLVLDRFDVERVLRSGGMADVLSPTTSTAANASPSKPPASTSAPTRSPASSTRFA